MPSPSTPCAKQLFTQGLSQHEAGRLGNAEAFYTDALRHDKAFHPAWFQLGVLAAGVNKLGEAVRLIGQASGCAPQEFTYPRALCEIHRRLGQLDHAVRYGALATALNPRDAAGFYNHGLALFDAQRFEEAARAYRQAVTLAPDYGLAYNNLGSAYEALGDDDAAYAAYEKAVAINPRHVEAQHNLASLDNQYGRRDAARSRYRAALTADPRFVPAHHGLSTLKRYTPGDPDVLALEDLALRAPQPQAGHQAKLWFTLGKAREDLGQFDAAFEAYARGNAQHRQTFAYNPQETRRQAADVVERFNPEATRRPVQTSGHPTPIFIVGMPRSGSTLIEQILDCHPYVQGAGELDTLSKLVGDVVPEPAGTSYIDWLNHADDDALQALGDAYLQRLGTHANGAPHVIDKMPGNFFYVGLIHKLFPHARVIHSARNPWDTCVSNFTRLYKSAVPFAYDLGELGQFCRLCDDMMAHWKAALPSDFIYEARYEALVDDFEPRVRSLVDFCGLPWDDACLNFHENKRVVKTASRAQVVKPLYRTSVERWKSFQKHLAPLFQGYGQASPLTSSPSHPEN